MRECIVIAPTTDLQRSGLSVPGEAARNGSDGGYEARIALDDAAKADAYALRYRSYLAGGHIAPNPSQSFSDRFDDMPNATTIIVYRAGQAVGSVRVCLVSRGPGTTSPGREAYPDEVETLLQGCGPAGPGFDGVEVNRLVCAPGGGQRPVLGVRAVSLGRPAYLGGRAAGRLCLRAAQPPAVLSPHPLPRGGGSPALPPG